MPPENKTKGMPDTIRTFIAIELPQRLIVTIHDAQESLKSYNFKIKWVRPENIHLTLKFLGNIAPVDLDPVGQIISESVKGHSPVSLTAKGTGVFPSIKHPRIIWIGLSGQIPQLKVLQQTLDENLESIGFSRDKKAFKAHLTLGRIKSAINPSKLNAALNHVNLCNTAPFLADRVILFKSDLCPSGAVYTKLMSAALAT